MKSKHSLFSALVIIINIHKISCLGTPVSGIWNDDHHHANGRTASAISNGWFKQNKTWSRSKNKHVHNHLPNTTTKGSDGTIYYGPLRHDNSNVDFDNVTSNYFKRKFMCTVPTNIITIQYETALCEGKNHATGGTKLFFNGAPAYGWVHLDSNGTDGAYQLMDGVLITQCQSFTDSNNYYWVQFHSVTLKMNDFQNKDFDVTIRIDLRNDDAILLYDFTLECTEDDSNDGHPNSKRPSGMIDDEYDSVGHRFAVKIGTFFGIAIGICIILCIAYKVVKYVKIKSQVRYHKQLNEDDLDEGDCFVPM